LKYSRILEGRLYKYIVEDLGDKRQDKEQNKFNKLKRNVIKPDESHGFNF
jgi:hypothetical protein